MTDTANPTALVSPDWALQHLDDPNVRFVEVDVDTTSYEQSHLPGAVGWDWTSQLSDGIRRDIAGREDFSALLSAGGVTPETTIVLYGDNNNWFAAWAYWQLKLYGHEDVRILDGGRKYWLPPPPPPPAPHRRPSPRRVQRRGHRPARHERDGPAGGAHPGRRLGAVGPGRPRGRDLQERRRASRPLRRQGRDARQGHHRLLPDRRAEQPHVVRPPRDPRLPERPQLRWLLDRVGEHGRDAHREASTCRRRGINGGTHGASDFPPVRRPTRPARLDVSH